jgi:hypothetical protein
MITSNQSALEVGTRTIDQIRKDGIDRETPQRERKCNVSNKKRKNDCPDNFYL